MISRMESVKLCMDFFLNGQLFTIWTGPMPAKSYFPDILKENRLAKITIEERKGELGNNGYFWPYFFYSSACQTVGIA